MKRVMRRLALNASDGSVPDMAPALAAVKLSTSSRGEQWLASVRSRDRQTPTYKHHYKSAFIFYHFRDAGEQFLDQLSRLREPFRKE
jgi:hypothetical protein